MRDMLISIIVPVYNAERYLNECLDSLVSQTYRNIEIILVDDGSIDGSRAICERYASKDKRILIIKKRNGGAGSARNAGLGIAKGEYVCFCDSDDSITADAIERVAAVATERDVDIVMFRAVTVDEAGEEIPNDPYERKYDYSGISDPKTLFAEMKKNDEYSCCVPFMLIKKCVIRHKFIRTIHEDELFTPQILYGAESIAFLPDILYIRKIHDNSVTTTRKSAKNYTAMLHVIAGLEKIENKDRILVSHICDLYRTINVMYSKLDEAEKEKIKDLKLRADKHFIKKMISAEAGYKKLYCHAVLSKLYHAGKY